MSNLLKAIKLIIDNPITTVQEFYSSNNKANSIGEALENYIKDIFAGTFNTNESERKKRHDEVFSYLGNQNNPPDIILRKGDAIETKKVENPTSSLALNSSYPKSKLYSESSLITKACRECEDWKIKDIIYAVGYTRKTDLKYLWFVYGDCFAADREVYEMVRKNISAGLNKILNIEFTETKELGKIKKVDQLGITDLRVRGMWQIENPHAFFSYLNCTNPDSLFELICLLKTTKFLSFPEEDRNYLLSLKKEHFQISDVQIKNPNNPEQLENCKLITFRIFESNKDIPFVKQAVLF